MAFSGINSVTTELEGISSENLCSFSEVGGASPSGAVFVIAQKGADLLETPVFPVGMDGDDEAVAVFTDRQLAQHYLDEAEWSETDEVGQLSSLALLSWLREVNEAGIRYVMVNPNRIDHVAGLPQALVCLEDLAGHLPDSGRRVVQELAQG